MKKNLLSGLILLLPITITVILITFLVDLLTAPFLGHVESFFTFLSDLFGFPLLHRHALIIIISRVTILILLFLFVLILGFLGNRLFFNWIVKTVNALLMKIPLINAVYRACRDIIVAVLSDKQKIFSRIVIVPFPCKESRSLGLVAGNAPTEIQEASAEIHPENVIKTVFVPTSPHPISGFLLLTEEKYLSSCDMNLEDAFKFLVSCGIFTPKKGNSLPDQK